MKIAKSFSDITLNDIKRYPIWEYIYDDELYPDETWIRPVKHIPVKSLDNCIIGLQVKIANGEYFWAILEQIDLQDSRMTQQFLSINIYFHSKWIPLARYFDLNFDRFGPRQVAECLGLPIDDVFPIDYDFSHLVDCLDCITKGQILKEPTERLSHEDLDNIINQNLKHHRD